MRTRWRLSVLACSTTLGVLSCSDEVTRITPAQVLLYVDTDAPIPAGPGQRRQLATPLFDRLRIDIYRPGESAPCAGCTNEFELNGSIFEERKASVGIAPAPGVTGYRARVRLFRAAFANGAGEPNADSTVEATVALPVAPTNTIARATILLPTEEVGQPIGSLSAPKAPLPGAPERSMVGTWAGAERTTCKGGAPDGTVCVPGGAYWMGNPNAPGFIPGSYIPQPRLVILSPFFMSATEVTVREFRTLGRAPDRVWSGVSTGSDGRDWCTFTAAPGPLEAVPINCVSLEDARSYCVAHGGELPTEAQFEYVASGLMGNAFPWGRDEPTCADAIFGRGGWGILTNADVTCKQPEPPGSPSLPGGGTRDRIDLPTGTLLDLAGNMSEWTRDTWNRIDEPCWDHTKVYRDPFCATPSPHDGALAVHRGGNWAEASTYMVASKRYPLEATVSNVQIGFRCVWPSD